MFSFKLHPEMFIVESTLKIDSIAKVSLDHCIKAISYVNEGIDNPPSTDTIWSCRSRNFGDSSVAWDFGC